MEDSTLVTSSKQYKCSSCQLEFFSLHVLYKHKTLCNQNVKRSGCLKCGKELGENHFSCNDCDRCFTQLSFLHNHQVKHTVDSSIQPQDVGNTSQDSRLPPGPDKFKCDFCGKVSHSRLDMENHIKSHSREKPFECEICGRAFAYRGSLKAHVFTHSKRKRVIQFKCNLCHSVFDTKPQIEAHARAHTGIKPFDCDVCGKLFSYKRNLKAHRSIFHPEEPDVQKGFDNNSSSSSDKWYTIQHKEITLSIDNHNRGTVTTSRRHSDGKLLFCQKCPKKFPDLSSFLKHRRMHTDVKPYTCSLCNTGFCSSSSLKQHVASVHTEEDTNPDIVSETQVIKEEHEMPTEDESMTSYQCFECDRVFFQFGVFNRHKMMHTHAMQYQSKKSVKKEPEELDSLTPCSSQHNLSSPEVTQETDLLLQKLFKNRPPRQIELTGPSTPSVIDTEYTCFICGIHFKNKFALRAHQRLHSDAEQYPCSCGRNFSYHSSMLKHEKKHSTFHRYSCNDCGVYYLDVERLQMANNNKTHEKLCADLPKTFNPVLLDVDQIRRTCTMKSFLHPSNLQLQTQVHQVKNPFVFIDCSACCYKVSISNSHDQHEISRSITSSMSNVKMCTPTINKKLRKNKNIYKCHDCRKCFSVESDLRIHTRIHAEHLVVNTGEARALEATKRKVGECSLCAKVFSNVADLNKHWQLHNEEKLFKCHRCGFMFAGIRNRAKHEKSKACIEAFANKIENRKRDAYTCSECGKWFALKSALVIHNRVHVSETSSESAQANADQIALEVNNFKEGECLYCRKIFLNKHDIADHQLLHNGERLFECQKCGLMLCGLKNRDKHERSKSCREAYRYRYGECHTCTVCGQLFQKLVQLINHSKEHGGEQQFHCEKCGKEFSNSEALKRHEKKHKQQPRDFTRKSKSVLSSYLKMKRKMVGIKTTKASIVKSLTGHTSNQKTGIDTNPYLKDSRSTQLNMSIVQENATADNNDNILSDNDQVHNELVEANSYDAQQIGVNDQIIDSNQGTDQMDTSLNPEGSRTPLIDYDLLKQGNDEEMEGYRPYNAGHNPDKSYQKGDDVFRKISVFTDNDAIESQQEDQSIEQNKHPQPDDLMSQMAEMTYQALLQDGMESFNAPSKIYVTSTCLQLDDYPQIMNSDLPNPVEQEGLHQQRGVSSAELLKQEDINNARNTVIDPDKLLWQLEDFNSQTAQISAEGEKRIYSQEGSQLNMECDQDHSLQSKDGIRPDSHGMDCDHTNQLQQLDIHRNCPQNIHSVQELGEHTHTPLVTKSDPQNVLQSGDIKNIDVNPDQSLQQENIISHNIPNVEIDLQKHVEKGSSTSFYSENTDNNTETPLQQDDLNSHVSQNPCSAIDKSPQLGKPERLDHENKSSHKSSQLNDLEEHSLLDTSSHKLSGFEDLKNSPSVSPDFELHESWQQPLIEQNEPENKHCDLDGSRESYDSNNQNSMNTNSKSFCDSEIVDAVNIGIVKHSSQHVPFEFNNVSQANTASQVQPISFEQPSDECHLEPGQMDTKLDIKHLASKRSPPFEISNVSEASTASEVQPFSFEQLSEDSHLEPGQLDTNPDVKHLASKCSPCVESSSADVKNDIQCGPDQTTSDVNSKHIKSNRSFPSNEQNNITAGCKKRRVDSVSLKNAKQRPSVGGRIKTNSLKRSLPSSRHHAKVSQQSSDSPNAHECDQCHNTFFSAFNLNRHMRTHTGEKPYKCSKCGLCFADIGNLRKHRSNVHRDKCSKCGLSFSNIGNLKKHRRNVHRENMNNLTRRSRVTNECRKCDMEFISSIQLKKPKRCATKASTSVNTSNNFGTVNKNTITRSVDDSSTCSIATGPITLNDDPKNSIKIIFPSDSSFADSAYVSNSMNVENTCESDPKHSIVTDSSLPFECTDCGKRFPWLGNLKRHQRIHTDELNNSSLRKKDLDALNKTQITDIQPKSDGLPTSTLSSSSIVPSHITIEKSSSQPISQINNKKCRFCDKELPCLSKLIRHERTHTGEKPFACLECDRRYADSASLTKHSKSHMKLSQNQLSNLSLQRDTSDTVAHQASQIESQKEHILQEKEAEEQRMQTQQMLQISQQEMLLQQHQITETHQQIPQIEQMSLGQHQLLYTGDQQQIVQLNPEMSQDHQQIHQQMLFPKQEALQVQEQHYMLHDTQSMLQEQQPSHFQIPLQINQEISQNHHQTPATQFHLQQQPYQYQLQSQQQMPYQQHQALQIQPEITHAQPQMLYVQPIQTQPQLIQMQPQMIQPQPQVKHEQTNMLEVEQPTQQTQYIIPDVGQIPSGQQQIPQTQPQIQQCQNPVLQAQPQIQQGQNLVLQTQPQVQHGQLEIMSSLPHIPESLTQLPQSQQIQHTEHQMMQVEQQMLQLLDQIPQVHTQLPELEQQISETKVTEPIAMLSPTSKDVVTKKRAKPNQNPVKNHICAVCGKNFSNSYNVRRHMKLHTGTATVAATFTCDVCNSTFTHKSNFQRHRRIHERPHKCSHCTETFLDSTALTRHKCKQTKSMSDQLSVATDINDHSNIEHATMSQLNSFDDQNSLYTAIKSEPPDPMPDIDDALNTILHSLDVKVEEDSKPYECSVCKKKFYNKAVLDHHYSRTHKY